MKAERSPENSTIQEHISRVVMSMSSQNQGTIDPDYVANVVESRIDIHQVSPHLTKHLAILQLKQQIRAYLRHTFNPVDVVTDRLMSGQDDLFDDILQDYYPAERKVMDVMKSVYVKRDLLTATEVEENASKMEKASKALAQHAEALRAWFLAK